MERCGGFSRCWFRRYTRELAPYAEGEAGGLVDEGSSVFGVKSWGGRAIGPQRQGWTTRGLAYSDMQ